MTLKRWCLPLIIVLITCLSGTLPAQSLLDEPGAVESAKGTIEGVVIYDFDRRRPWRFRRNYVADRRRGHLAGAVVCLVGQSGTAAAANSKPQNWTIDQKEYRFIPQTLAIRAGDRIRFTNSDPLLHDVTTRQAAEGLGNAPSQDTFSLRQREEVFRTYRDIGGIERPVTLTCRFHGAMQGWIYLFDHPFFQVTAKEGEFRLTNVPAGKHRLVVVHPAGRLRWEQVVEVKAGETGQVEIHISPDNVVPIEE